MAAVPPEKEGTVHIRQEGQRWQRRWVVLNEGVISYYQNEKARRGGTALPIGTIDLLGCTCYDGEKRNTLIVETPEKDVYQLKTSKLDQYIAWSEAIRSTRPHPFGQDVTVLAVRDDKIRHTRGVAKPARPPPALVLTKMLDELRHRGGLREAGIFKLAPRPEAVQAARASFGGGIDPDKGDLSAHSIQAVGAMVCQWLKEMPDPMVPHATFEQWSATQHEREASVRIPMLRKLALQLDEARYANLSALLPFLAEVASQADVNRMNAEKLGAVFGPLVLRPPKVATGREQTLQSVEAGVMTDLIMNWAEILRSASMNTMQAGLESHARRKDSLAQQGMVTAQVSAMAGAKGEGGRLVQRTSENADAEELSQLLVSGEDPGQVDGSGRTALHWAAHHGSVNAISVLTKAGVPLNKCDSMGMAPLHTTAREGQFFAAKALLLAGAPVDLPDLRGRTALAHAVMKNHDKVLQLLLAKGANVMARAKSGRSILHYAAGGSDYRVVAFLVENGAVADTTDSHGSTALHVAARLGRNKIALVLVSKKLGNATINIANSDGDTPLHLAAIEGDEGLMKLLIGMGGDPVWKNKKGEIPLHIACKSGNESVAVYLVQRGGPGGDPLVRDAAGRSCLSIAPEALRNSISRLFKPEQEEEGDTAAPAMPEREASALVVPTVAKDGLPKDGRPTTPVPMAALPHAPADAEEDEVDQVAEAVEQVQVEETPAKQGDGEDRAVRRHRRHRRHKEEEEEEPAAPVRQEWEIDYKDLVIGKLIGKGGYGEVFKGEWLATEVAIKKLLVQRMKPKDLAEFRGEVDTMSRLRHPNIVLFMGACTEGKELAIVTEYCSRGSLFHVLRDPELRSHYSWSLMIQMAIGIARGMCYLHGMRPPIIHRDMKSLNVLVDENLHVKVCDFGLTKVKAKAYMMTRVGTPQWMAPEVLRGERYNEKADVYSFGIVLWEMYTRRAPYQGIPPMTVGQRVLKGERPPLPKNTPSRFKSLVERCWHNNPKVRPDFMRITKELGKLTRG